MKKILSWLFGQTSFIIIMLALQLYIILSSAFRIASDEALAAVALLALFLIRESKDKDYTL